MIEIRAMTLDDYEAVYALWRESEGVGLSTADEKEAIAQFLIRNAGLSQTAWEGARLAGAALCGHDGRRGYLHHLAIAEPYRRRKVGSEIVRSCLRGLRQCGIEKCHLFVFAENAAAQSFWKSVGWTERVDLKVLSTLTEGR
jgi:ribosomal protein S18 acetylase RimI-like enzyme